MLKRHMPPNWRIPSAQVTSNTAETSSLSLLFSLFRSSWTHPISYIATKKSTCFAQWMPDWNHGWAPSPQRAELSAIPATCIPVRFVSNPRQLHDQGRWKVSINARDYCGQPLRHFSAPFLGVTPDSSTWWNCRRTTWRHSGWNKTFSSPTVEHTSSHLTKPATFHVSPRCQPVDSLPLHTRQKALFEEGRSHIHYIAKQAWPGSRLSS